MSDEFEYDSVPYPSFVFPQTHPDRLATLAVLHGLKAPEPGQCRYLELGCGDGSNVLALAYALPESEFVGIDLSRPHIADANAAADALGLTNVTFRQEDVTGLDSAELGKFDLIVAHGLFSWVPDVVREHILRIYSDCLTADGIGYISYNALPGCHIRQITNEMMQFHTRSIDDAETKVSEGISLLDFVANAAESDSLYQTILQLESEQIKERSISNVFHDDLSVMNRPFYFYEFAEMIAANGLTYLCEAEPTALREIRLSPEAINVLDQLGGDIIRREQYRDFITAKRFRSTLICRSDKQPTRTFAPTLVNKFLVATQIELEEQDTSVTDSSPVKFRSAKEASITVNHPLTKAFLVELRKSWTRPMTFADAVRKARSVITDATDEDVDTLRGYLMQLYFGGFVKFHLFQPRFLSSVTERPVASKFARWQLDHNSKSVTTLNGTNLEPEHESIRFLIGLLDGEHDRDAIVEEMIKMAAENAAELPERKDLEQMIEDNLQTIASAGLLIA